MEDEKNYVGMQKGWRITIVDGLKYNAYNQEKDKSLSSPSLVKLRKKIDKEVVDD